MNTVRWLIPYLPAFHMQCYCIWQYICAELEKVFRWQAKVQPQEMWDDIWTNCGTPVKDHTKACSYLCVSLCVCMCVYSSKHVLVSVGLQTLAVPTCFRQWCSVREGMKIWLWAKGHFTHKHAWKPDKLKKRISVCPHFRKFGSTLSSLQEAWLHSVLT